jgi:hypothetical protein
MSWERYTCTNTRHLSVPHRLSVNVTPVKGIDTVFASLSRLDLLMRSHNSFSIWQADKRIVLYVSSIILCVAWPAKRERITLTSRYYQPSRCSMEQRESTEPTECPNGQDFRQFRNTKARCRVNSSVPLVPTSSQIYPAHAFTPALFLKIHEEAFPTLIPTLLP